jgi:hypothetical protein
MLDKAALQVTDVPVDAVLGLTGRDPEETQTPIQI